MQKCGAVEAVDRDVIWNAHCRLEQVPQAADRHGVVKVVNCVRYFSLGAVVARSQDLPPVLQAIVGLDAWNEIAVLQYAPWLGRLLAASILLEGGVTTGAHLASINLGLKAIPVDRRWHRDWETRLLAIAGALTISAETGLKEHDRLVLAWQMMMRKLEGRRTSSRLPELVDVVMARPLISAGMVAKTLEVTPQGARRIVQELGLREMTGRGRFRAWGII